MTINNGCDGLRPAAACKVREHVLKTWPAYFDALEAGDKNFEVRRDDRGFQRGDILVLQRTMDERKHEVDVGPDWEPRHVLRKRIIYVLTGGQFGIEPGYVVMGLEDESPARGSRSAATSTPKSHNSGQQKG